jgi:L-threonylcarbamoyladenylate synthase
MAIIDIDIQTAVAYLKQDQVIGMPTETVYGLAGNALSVKAVTKIFEVKNRPTFDPLIVHTAGIEHLQLYVRELPEKARLLAERFMPGPLTLLLPKADVIPDLVTSGLDSVAIRIPEHPLALALLKELPFPLAAPSANPFGYISPTNASHVNQQLGTLIPYILDGGASSIGIESTIVGFEEDKVIVYRKGGLAIEQIEAVIGQVFVNEHSSSNPQAPGMLKSHYAPRKLFVLVDSLAEIPENQNIAFLGFDKYLPFLPKQNQLLLSEKGDLAEAAQHLFAYLRQLDDMDVSQIYGQLLPEVGLGRAINDRLRRASA